MPVPETIKEISPAQRISTQRLLRDFVNNSEIGFAIFDEELRYQAVNPWLATSDGISADLHLGKHLREVIGEISLRVEPVIKKIFNTGRPVLNFEVEGKLPAKPERKRWIASLFPLKDAEGNVKQVAAIIAELKNVDSQSGRFARMLPNVELLRSWKDIAGYMGTCTKTAQRWEQLHHLPIRRVKTGKGGVVFALKAEIDNWMRSHPSENR
ncbi:MAG TPA: PAS domain-containing protein [Terriglobales bacterium]|jgi:transcriptional regulator with PAS, ATPase and Fis domain|nr:PAS domain-containing protein [Terriglobales bacterium]